MRQYLYETDPNVGNGGMDLGNAQSFATFL